MHLGIAVDGIANEYLQATTRDKSINDVRVYYPFPLTDSSDTRCLALLMVSPYPLRRKIELILPRSAEGQPTFSVIECREDGSGYFFSGLEYDESMQTLPDLKSPAVAQVTLNYEPTSCRSSRRVYSVNTQHLIEHYLEGEDSIDFYRLYRRRVKLVHERDMPQVAEAAVYTLAAEDEVLFDSRNCPRNGDDDAVSQFIATCPPELQTRNMYVKFKDSVLPNEGERRVNELLERAGLAS